MSDQPKENGISLRGFTAPSHGGELASYISALESFDQLEQLQELKRLGHERTGIAGGTQVLEVGDTRGHRFLRQFKKVMLLFNSRTRTWDNV